MGEAVFRAPRWSTTWAPSAASASAKLFPSFLLLKRTRRWWWGRMMGMAGVRTCSTSLSSSWIIFCHYKQLYLDTHQMVLKLHDNCSFAVFSLKVTVFVSFLSLSQVKVVTAERRLSVFSLSQTLSALSASGQYARVLALINNASLPVPCLLQSHITGRFYSCSRLWLMLHKAYIQTLTRHRVNIMDILPQLGRFK